jgi:hypothetical protein
LHIRYNGDGVEVRGSCGLRFDARQRRPVEGSWPGKFSDERCCQGHFDSPRAAANPLAGQRPEWVTLCAGVEATIGAFLSEIFLGSAIPVNSRFKIPRASVSSLQDSVHHEMRYFGGAKGCPANTTFGYGVLLQAEFFGDSYRNDLRAVEQSTTMV